LASRESIANLETLLQAKFNKINQELDDHAKSYRDVNAKLQESIVKSRPERDQHQQDKRI